MERVRIGDLDNELGPAAEKRRLTGPLGATDLALTYYELDPGDAFGFGYHRHADQEEVFVIEAGTVTFRTEDGPVEVSAGEVIRFGPGERQRGINRGEERVKAMAIGAPQDAGETDILRFCDACGEDTSQTIEWAPDGDDALVTECLDCGAITGRFVHGPVEPEA